MLTLREAMPVDTDADYERRPLCANEFTQRQAIEKILNHLGLDPRPPPKPTNKDFSPNNKAVKEAA